MCKLMLDDTAPMLKPSTPTSTPAINALTRTLSEDVTEVLLPASKPSSPENQSDDEDVDFVVSSQPVAEPWTDPLQTILNNEEEITHAQLMALYKSFYPGAPSHQLRAIDPQDVACRMDTGVPVTWIEAAVFFGEQKWHLHYLIPAGQVTMVFGSAGVGKSTYVLAVLVKTLVNGGSFMGTEYPGGEVVVWYDGEGCSGANMERAKTEGIDQSLIYNVSTKASLDTEEGVDELQQAMIQTAELAKKARKKDREEIQKKCKAKGLPIPCNFDDELKMVLVLDGITNLTGTAEENNAKEGARHIVLITKMLQSFDWDINPAAIVITHSTKDCWKMNTGDTLTEPTPAEAGTSWATRALALPSPMEVSSTLARASLSTFATRSVPKAC